MTDKYTDLENAVSKCTDGPWVSGLVKGKALVATPNGVIAPRGNYYKAIEDTKFIALARTQVPELLADLKAAREEVERLTLQVENYRFGGKEKVWVSTEERLPTKPGLSPYEHIDCYIFVDGRVLERPWNCEHECWDDAEYDDFEFDAHKPSHWMLRAPFPASPQPPTDKDADNE